MVEMTGLDNASLVSFSYISHVGNSKSKNRSKKNTFKTLIITRNRVVAKQSRCEGVYNRTGDLSVICFGKEKRRRE